MWIAIVTGCLRPTIDFRPDTTVKYNKLFLRTCIRNQLELSFGPIDGSYKRENGGLFEEFIVHLFRRIPLDHIAKMNIYWDV